MLRLLAASRRVAVYVAAGVRVYVLLHDPILLRPSEAAFHLGVCRSTVYALIHEGAIPSVRLGKGKSVRVPLDRLRAIINERTTINNGTPGNPLAA